MAAAASGVKYPAPVYCSWGLWEPEKLLLCSKYVWPHVRKIASPRMHCSVHVTWPRALPIQLSQDVLARTVTSAKTCTLPLPGATGLVDAITTVPGHPSALRELEAELPAAGKIVVWIDAGAVGSQVPPAARQLYRVLTDASIVDADVPVLIVANKADLPTAITSTKLKQLLEKEMYVPSAQGPAAPPRARATPCSPSYPRHALSPGIC